jgi:predicted heme/steroid binding protein
MKRFVPLYLLLAAIACLHIGYTYSTRFTTTIHVLRTYTSLEFEGNHTFQTTYHVVDINGRVYDVSNSLWLWEWGAADKWARLQKGNAYTVSGYGKYIKFVDMHPNITRIHGPSA